MTRPRLTARQWIGYGGFALVAILTAAVAEWRGDIVMAGLDPEVPFQTYQAPPAPNYARPDAWIMREVKAPDAAAAAIFFVPPTAFDGGRDWNAPIGDPASRAFMQRVVLPNYVGPFARAGTISVPDYRQASVYTRLTLREDAREARAFAYRDVAAAFDDWIARHPTGPIVLAGVEQGAEQVDRLLRERIAGDASVSSRVVVVYLIDAIVARERLPTGFSPCQTATSTHCVVAWSPVSTAKDGAGWRRLLRALVWDDEGRLVELGERTAVCVNPVSGSDDGRPTEARRHRGATNATGLEWGARPALTAREVSAECRDGLLRYSQPNIESFRKSGSWADRRKVLPYNLFYGDLENDVKVRMAAPAAA